MELNEMKLSDVETRIAELDKEVEAMTEVADIEKATEEKRSLIERKAELEAIEQRKQIALELNSGAKEPEKVIESRKEEQKMNELETRAAEFVKTGRTEMRALLSTGNIAKPSKVGGISDLAAVASDIVDDVNAIALTGAGSWVVAYKSSDAIAADVTDGNDVAGTASAYNYVTINPSEWGVLDQISKQVKKMTPLDYQGAIQNSALIALRAKASSKIVTAVKASALTETKNNVALDENYLKNVALGFRAVPTKGAVCLYLKQDALLTLGKVRGTNEKEAVYKIAFDAGSTTSGTISEGALAVRFRVLDQLSTGEQLFGQPGAIDMPMWDGYSIETDEGGKYFDKNQIGIRGLQTAGADVVAYHAMQLIKNPQ